MQHSIASLCLTPKVTTPKESSSPTQYQSMNHQVKSQMYYIFWGICTAIVFSGQLIVASGYYTMSDSFNTYVRTLRSQWYQCFSTGYPHICGKLIKYVEKYSLCVLYLL